MNREQIFQLQKDYLSKGWYLELNVNRFFDTNGKEKQNYIFFDGCVATLSKDDIKCYLVSCGERKFTYDDSYYRRVEDINIYNDEELSKANIEFIDNGWYELQICKGMDYLSEGDDIGDDDTFSNIDDVQETIDFIMSHIDLGHLDTYEELNSLSLKQLENIYFEELGALEPLENAQAYRNYISSYCVSDGTPLR